MNNTKLNKNNKEKWITFTDAIEYSKAIKMMKSKVEKIKNGLLGEQILLLEHPSVYTAGTSSKDSDLIIKNDIPIYKTERGGQWTWHGPGQRIVWPLLDLNHRKKDVKLYVYHLEEWIIDVLNEIGIKGIRKNGAPGVWVSRKDINESKRLDKIAALGIRISKWVTSHGISININPSLKHFDGIIPCGIYGSKSTSIYQLGVNISSLQLDKIFKNTFKNHFGKNKIMGRI